MPISSNQISGMVGGQMAMFSNQAQFSQQIGGMAGTSPSGMAGGMQNPYPSEDRGSQMAGGLGMAIPGVGAGLGMAGMVTGGALGWMDPFTAGGRGFAGGAGMAGQGAGQVLGQVGRTFATGGLRAGAGMIGGGIAGAAMAAAPAMAIGAGLQFMGENIYQGAQNISEVGGMANQYFGSQSGQAGSRSGGKMARQEIKNVTTALREIVDDDTKTSMEELKRVMDQAGRAGMLGGIGSAQEFKQKFQGMVRQMRQVADFMGSSLEEVAPLLGQMKTMGLWSAGDVMGTLTAGKTAGAAAPQMMQTMQAGSQMSHAMGGDLRSGALLGRQQFSTIRAAQESGVLSERDIAEFTGGKTGAAGQQAVAQRMTGIMAKLGETPGQRMMMAALGETDEEGIFTGKADEGMMARFKKGEFSINELQKMGMKKASSKGGALSFHRVQKRLSQDVSQTGGLEAMGQMVSQVADRIGGPREEVQHRLLMQMGNMNERDAEMMQKLLQELPQIRDKQARAARDTIDQAFDNAQRKGTQGWDAFKTSVGQQWEKMKEPFQKMGERLATDFGEMSDSLSDKISGRVRGIPMGSEERTRLMRDFKASDMGALPENMGQEWATGNWQTNMNTRMRRGGLDMSGFAGGAAMGLIGVAKQMFGAGEESTPHQQALQAIGAGLEGGAEGNIGLGGGVTTTRTRMEKMVRSAHKRAANPTATALGITDSDRLGRVQTKLGAVLGQNSATLSQLKKDDPRAYIEKVMSLVSGSGAAGEDPLAGLSKEEKLNYLAVAQEQAGIKSEMLSLDFQGQARDVGMAPTTPEEMKQQQDELLNEMVEAGGGRSVVEGIAKGAAGGAAGGGALGGFLGAGVGAMVGGVTGGINALMRDSGITKSALKEALTGEGASIFAEWTQDGDIEKAKTKLLKVKGGDQVIDLLDKIQKSGSEDKFKALGEKFGRLRSGQAFMESAEGIRGAAAGTQEKLRGLGAESQGRYAALRKQLSGAGDDTLSGGEWERGQEMVEEMALGLGEGEITALSGRRGGAIGSMVAATREAMDIGEGSGGIGDKELQGILKRFRGRGIDLAGDKDIAGLLEGGISGDERGEFAEIAKKISKSGIAGSAEAAKSHTERMNELLMGYTKANTDFVKAVHGALGDDISSAHDKVVEAGETGKIAG